MNVKHSLPEPSVCRATTRNRRADLIAAAGLCAVVFTVHFGSLQDGLFFDDHWHRATLRHFDWGFDDLIESATFDLPGELVNLWWQEQPLQWRYARPAAMLFMKLELIASGGSPFGVHLCSLFWHSATTFMVYLCALWVVRSRWWAFVAATTFACQPHGVFGVSWIAARNALVSGFFFLAAFYAYAAAPVERSGRCLSPSAPRLLVVLLLWGLALFSRESAVVFSVLAPLLDLTRGGWRLVKQRGGLYILIWLLTGAYLYWRLFVFPIAGPPSIYFTSPGGAMYPLWALSKLLHMVFALVFQTPMFLGLATYDAAFTTQAILYGVMAVLLAAIGAWYLRTSRGLRTRWFWPLWMVGAFVPVIPVFVMPHFAYLPAAAFSVMLGVMFYRLKKGWRGAVAALVIGATLWSFAVYRCLWRGILRSEQLIYADIVENTPRPDPGASLFFLNIPVTGIYAPAALRERWAQPDLEGYVLTFAPSPLMMESSFTVERVNDYELEASIEPPGYFSGLSGRMLVDGMRPEAPLTSGLIVPGEMFDTTVVAADSAGVTRLRFTFKRSLDSEDYYFYVSSPVRPAFRLRFDETPDEIDHSWEDLLARARSSDVAQRAAARAELAERLLPAAVQTGASIQTLLTRPETLTDAEAGRLATWSRDNNAPRILNDTLALNHKYAAEFRERRRYFQIADFAAGILSSDLYLTGKGAE